MGKIRLHPAAIDSILLENNEDYGNGNWNLQKVKEYKEAIELAKKLFPHGDIEYADVNEPLKSHYIRIEDSDFNFEKKKAKAFQKLLTLCDVIDGSPNSRKGTVCLTLSFILLTET